MEPLRVETQFAGRRLAIETGVLAKQASGSVLIRYGDTAILCVASLAQPRAGIDFFPLMVDYEEKFYASGKIKGSRFVKREGRPSDTAVLASRLIDRPIRPLFPKDFVNEVQIITTVLSADLEVPPATTALVGASAALLLSGAPFEGPLGAVRIGMVDGKFIVNPTYEQIEHGQLDLVVAAVSDGVMMVEAGAKEVTEAQMLEAMELATREIDILLALQQELLKKVTVTPYEYTPYRPGDETIKMDDITFRLMDLKTQVSDYITESMLDDVVFQPTKTLSEQAHERLEAQCLEKFGSIPEFPGSSIKLVVESIMRKHVRRRIIEDGRRPDGRGPRDVRPISIATGLLPRTHGSAVFQRGETQALTITTLGSKGAAQVLDEMDNDRIEHYMHHYNFPPYSVGEVRPLRSPGRREIGHGHLAERAIRPMLPSIEEFPYTMRVVSEILESNGSSSMASTCGSTLSLMDAGVPLKRPVSGIAMGLMSDKDSGKYAILSDIKDIEDFGGDMDFKVAGTTEGITALQMDIKLKGVPLHVLGEALAQAKEGRAFILQRMLEAIATPRKELSPYAPRVTTFKVHPDQIRTIIGPGGKMINEIIDTCKVEIDVEDDGSVFVTSADAGGMERAVQWIKDLTSTMEVGEVFEGTVVKIVMDKMGKDVGAIVEKSKGKDGMVHISELAPFRVNRVADICKVGDKMRVKVVDVDRERGRVSLSRKALISAAPAPRPAAPAATPSPAPTAASPTPAGAPRPTISLEDPSLP